MNTGQTLLAIGALAILMTIMMNFYGVLGRTGQPIDDAQFGISATTLGTSFMEFAHGLHFDEITVGQHITEASALTMPGMLGTDVQPDTIPQETQMMYYNDFDDFHGDSLDTDLGDLGTYRSSFEVFYVQPTNIETRVNFRTFTKRMNVKIWRVNTATTDIDTVRLYTVMGYFHFD